MKIKARKVAALLLAATLMSVSGNSAMSPAFGAEDPNAALPAETVTEAVETQAPETQAPETQAPETQPPETQAPETQPPETQPPETQLPETQAPETQPPETQAQTQASEAQPESAAAQSETAAAETAASEKQSETKATEPETEEEGKTRSFETNTSKGTISVKLPKGKGVAKSAELVCSKTEYSEDKGNRGKVDKVILGKQRVITDARFYELSLKDGDEVINIPEGTQITFTRGDGIDLSLKPLLQAKTHLYNVSSDSAQEISGSIDLNGDLRVTGFSFSAPKKLRAFALVAEENRANDGGAVSRGSVISSIGEAGRYAAVGAAVNGKVEDDNISNSEDLLNSLAGYSVSLANAQSGGDAAVVNIYTDSDGNVQTDAGNDQDPMRAVLSGGDIDVSGRMVVLNYVVTNPDTGYVALPHYGVVSDGAAVNRKQNSEQAGRLVVTVTKIAEGTDGNYTLAPYTGEIGIAKRGVGTYLVPQGSISIDGKLTGAAYAGTINIGKDIIKSTVRTESGDDAPATETEETESETEDVAETEPETENVEETEGSVVLSAADEGQAETMLAPVMLMAAAEDGEDEETLQAQADETESLNDNNRASGGINIASVGKTVKVSKIGANSQKLGNAKLALYNKTAFTFRYKKSENPDEYVSVLVPANTKIYDWDSSDTEEEDISPYIKAENGSGVLLSGIEYVIREEVIPTNYSKAWDFSFTCSLTKPDNTVKINLTNNGSAADPSSSSPVGETTGPVTISIVDRPENEETVYHVAVCDSAVETPTEQKGYLKDVPIQIRQNYDGSGAVAVEFTSGNGSIPVDLSTLANLIQESPSEANQVVQKEFAILEKDVYPGYLFDSNNVSAVDAHLIPFTVKKTYNSDYPDNPTVSIEGLPSDKNLTFKQKEFKFNVGSRYDSKYIKDTSFELKVGNDSLKATDYTITGGVAGKTIDNSLAEIKLTAEGWKKLHPSEAEWNTLTLKWTDVPYDKYFTATPKATPDPVDVFKEKEIKNENVIVDLSQWRFNIAALVSGTPLADVKFTLTSNNTQVDYRIDGGAATGATKGSVSDITLANTDTGWKLLHPDANTWNTLKINWTSAPAGYEFEPGAVTNVDVSAGSEVRINLDPWTFSIGSGVDGKAPYIAGTVFELKAGSNVLTAGTHYTTTNTTDGTLRSISLTKDGADLVKAAGSLTLNAVSAPSGYTIKGATYTQAVANGGSYVIPLEKIVPAQPGSISVIKQTRVADGSRYYVPDKSGRTFYVSAFSDTNLSTKVAGPARMDVPYSTDTSNNKGSSYQTATLEGLTRGAYYYLAETDQNGTPVVSANIGVSQIMFSDDGNAFADGNSHPVRLELNEAVKQVYLRNIYPTAGLTTGSFQIKLNVVDHENKPLASALTANFKVAGGDGTRLKNLKTIQLSNETTKTLKDISYRWSGDKIRITASLQTLTDASGASVLSSYSLVDPKTYAVLATGTAIPKYLKTRITLTSAEKNQQTLEFTLKKVKTEKEIAELKLTKAVTYKKTPIRVNGTYYIGIFSDAKHTKILYKKAMSLANASSMTSTLKINLYKLAAPHTITLYFAETDKNGKVVSSGSKSGYDISLNKTSVTLSPTNADESIVLTNDVRDGSVAAANLTNPSSGFAGDSSALAEAQALSNNETKSSKPTGDDTPFEPFAMATGISAGIIFLLLALLAARKKWGARF